MRAGGGRDGPARARSAAPPNAIEAVALVKGRFSFIAAPDGRAFRFEGGGVGLATSGSGDVLAGIVGGLAARGADPLTATLWGVWLHGEAGRILTERVGRVGFLAREIADLVPGLPDGTVIRPSERRYGYALSLARWRSSSSPIRRATWTTLVEPGTPNGTPAVTMIRSPRLGEAVAQRHPLRLADHLLEAVRRRGCAPHARPTICRAAARS